METQETPAHEHHVPRLASPCHFPGSRYPRAHHPSCPARVSPITGPNLTQKRIDKVVVLDRTSSCALFVHQICKKDHTIDDLEKHQRVLNKPTSSFPYTYQMLPKPFSPSANYCWGKLVRQYCPSFCLRDWPHPATL